MDGWVGWDGMDGVGWNGMDGVGEDEWMDGWDGGDGWMDGICV